MTLDLYELRWEHRFMADCRLIHPDQSVLDRAVAGITIALERRPEIFQLFDKDRRLRVASVLYHVASGPSAIHVEPLFATFRIEKPRPGGLVSLRRLVTRADLLGGLHAGTPELPPAGSLPETDPFGLS